MSVFDKYVLFNQNICPFLSGFFPWLILHNQLASTKLGGLLYYYISTVEVNSTDIDRKGGTRRDGRTVSRVHTLWEHQIVELLSKTQKNRKK